MRILNIFKADTEHHRLGRYGERVAARYLKKQGYKIRQRNFVAADAEIDIICESADTIVYVEVKTRTVGHATEASRPAAAVTPEKQRKILRAARFYKPRHHVHKRQRFDIVEVYTDGKQPPHTVRICHMPGAFTRDTAYPPGRAH